MQVIERTARILRALEGETAGLSLAEIASRVGLARSTVHRMVVALAVEGLVAPVSPNGRVRLGPLLARLGASGGRDIATRLRPLLARLSEQLRETVNLAVLEHDQVLVIEQVAGRQLLTVYGIVGETLPLHCTSNGKALLAGLSDEQVLRLLPPMLERYTPKTITEHDALLAELSEVRRTGISFALEEYALGLCSMGILVPEGIERPVAVSFPVPAQRYYGREQELSAALLEARAEIERGL